MLFRSHEFQVLAESGEDAIAWCPDSDFAANLELAEALAPAAPRAAAAQAMAKVPTPGKTTCEDVSALLQQPLQRSVKAVALMAGLPLSTAGVTGPPAPRLLLDHS